MIQRQQYKGDLAIGRRTKTTIVASLDTVVETTQLVADTVTTLRSTVELLHGSLQPAIAEQRIEYATIVQDGITKLTANGMSVADAKQLLQVGDEFDTKDIKEKKDI